MEVAKALIKKGSIVDAKALDGATPLYVACGKGHADIAAYLLSLGADKEVQVGNDRLTPINIASTKDFPDVVTLLAKHGALLSATDKNGLTVLHRTAAKVGYLIKKFLL